MLVIASLLSLALVAPAQLGVVQDPPPARSTDAPVRVDSAAEVDPARDPNREVCRREQSSVGSNRPRRVCAPAWQWEQARTESRDRFHNGNNAGPGGATVTESGGPPPGRGF